jgi:hypothetical protein
MQAFIILVGEKKIHSIFYYLQILNVLRSIKPKLRAVSKKRYEKLPMNRWLEKIIIWS